MEASGMRNRPARAVVENTGTRKAAAPSAQGWKAPLVLSVLSVFVLSGQAFAFGGTGLRLRSARAQLAERNICSIQCNSDGSTDGKGRNKKAVDPMYSGTTHVYTDENSMVEVGCINTKREFIVDAHLLGNLPEHLEPGAKIGDVSLVGAGPGDPDLLTVAALKSLQSADLVVSDRLVSAEILALVKGELKVARKLPGCAHEAQREIFRWCVEALLEGKNVVRLKIGDPFVFGRGGEEVLEFRRLGFEPKVIPGISSALAGPLAAGIPVTHRGVANRVVFMTGNGKDDSTPDVAPYHPDQTCVFLMAVGRLPELSQQLLRDGYPHETPVGIIERATTPRERTVVGSVADIAEVAERDKVQAPAIIVVGEVVNALRQPMSGVIPETVASLPRQLIRELLESRI
mmetsp:Transcript_19461/g.39447  ORF Transcript_19461/g.39447 Transcript_19461/m.39447 type:complete len:402 (-) Transcript_19461:76-1281(-)